MGMGRPRRREVEVGAEGLVVDLVWVSRRRPYVEVVVMEWIPVLCSLAVGLVVVGDWRLTDLSCQLCTVLVVQVAPQPGLLVGNNRDVGMLWWTVLIEHYCSLDAPYSQLLELGRLVLTEEATSRYLFVSAEAQRRLDLAAMIMVLRRGWPSHLPHLYPEVLLWTFWGWRSQHLSWDANRSWQWI